MAVRGIENILSRRVGALCWLGLPKAVVGVVVVLLSICGLGVLWLVRVERRSMSVANAKQCFGAINK